jgi:drug/metabolite transporter (DMT)-like permease
MSTAAVHELEESRLGALAAVIAVTVWGIGPVLIKFVSLPSMTIALYRFWIGAVVFTAALYLRGARLDRTVLRQSAPGGLVFAANIAFFFAAVKQTTVTDASVIAALQPVILLFVASRRFGERIRLADVALSGVSLAGVLLVITGTASTSAHHRLLGDVLAVGALITWAWYFVASKAARQHLGALEYQAGLLVVGAAALTPVALLAVHQTWPTSGQWAWLLVIALGPGGGHLLMNWAHGHIQLSVASLLTLASPAISAVGAALFVDEPLVAAQVVGVGVVLGALALIVVNNTRTAAAAAVEPVE